jgi:hypothetical protein
MGASFSVYLIVCGVFSVNSLLIIDCDGMISYW